VRAAYVPESEAWFDDLASPEELAAMQAAQQERARVKLLALYVCQRMGFTLQAYIQAHAHTRAQTYTRTQTHTWVCVYICTHTNTHKHNTYIYLQDTREGTTDIEMDIVTDIVTDIKTGGRDAEKRGYAKEIVDKTNAMLSDLKMSRNSNVVYVLFIYTTHM
jgi:hypothetical protein